MNTTQIRAYRELANTISKPGEFALVDCNDKLIMGWLTEERAKEYEKFYIGANIVTMEEFYQYHTK